MQREVAGRLDLLLTGKLVACLSSRSNELNVFHVDDYVMERG